MIPPSSCFTGSGIQYCTVAPACQVSKKHRMYLAIQPPPILPTSLHPKVQLSSCFRSSSGQSKGMCSSSDDGNILRSQTSVGTHLIILTKLKRTSFQVKIQQLSKNEAIYSSSNHCSSTNGKISAISSAVSVKTCPDVWPPFAFLSLGRFCHEP